MKPQTPKGASDQAFIQIVMQGSADNERNRQIYINYKEYAT